MMKITMKCAIECTVVYERITILVIELYAKPIDQGQTDGVREKVS